MLLSKGIVPDGGCGEVVGGPILLDAQGGVQLPQARLSHSADALPCHAGAPDVLLDFIGILTEAKFLWKLPLIWSTMLRILDSHCSWEWGRATVGMMPGCRDWSPECA